MTAVKVGMCISFLPMDRNGDGDDYPMCPFEAQGSRKCRPALSLSAYDDGVV
jgi:hypothetical protein